MLACFVFARAEDQARGQRFVVQAGAVEPSHRDEPFDRRGPLWWDTGALHLAGNQFAQRHGQIQGPIADDARGPKEQSLQFHQLWLSPIETLEGRVRVLDEIGRNDGLRPGVERSSIEQEPECCKIRSAVPLGASKRHRDVDETSDKVRLLLEEDWRSDEKCGLK
jgi:hypothetical protein